MITVHHLNNSRSQRVLWLLEELGVPYEIKRYERDPKTMFAPASLQEVHPLGKSPVITDGELTIAESGAIIEYLVKNYGNGRLVPAPDTPEHLRYTYWLHYAEGSAMPPLLLKLIFDQIEKSQCPLLCARSLGGSQSASKVRLLNLRLHCTWIIWRQRLERTLGLLATNLPQPISKSVSL